MLVLKGTQVSIRGVSPLTYTFSLNPAKTVFGVDEGGRRVAATNPLGWRDFGSKVEPLLTSPSLMLVRSSEVCVNASV